MLDFRVTVRPSPRKCIIPHPSVCPPWPVSHGGRFFDISGGRKIGSQRPNSQIRVNLTNRAARPKPRAARRTPLISPAIDCDQGESRLKCGRRGRCLEFPRPEHKAKSPKPLALRQPPSQTAFSHYQCITCIIKSLKSVKLRQPPPSVDWRMDN